MKLKKRPISLGFESLANKVFDRYSQQSEWLKSFSLSEREYIRMMIESAVLLYVSGESIENSEIQYREDNKTLELSGHRFGALIAVKILRKSKKGFIWFCECDCGHTREVVAGDLMSGRVRSCGCSDGDLFGKEGKAKSRIYRIWSGMKARCVNPEIPTNKPYAKRGIKVCERWLDFMNFYNDTKSGYAPDLSLDRIDVNGDYEPANCRWATIAQQANNKTTNKWYEANGIKHTQKEWSKILGIHDTAIIIKMKRGYSFQEIYDHYIQKPPKHSKIKRKTHGNSQSNV